MCVHTHGAQRTVLLLLGSFQRWNSVPQLCNRYLYLLNHLTCSHSVSILLCIRKSAIPEQFVGQFLARTLGTGAGLW